MSIGRRMGLGFACLLLLLVGVAALHVVESRAMSERVRAIVETNSPKSALAQAMLNQINELAVQTRTITVLTEVKDIEQAAAQLQQSLDAYRAAESDLQIRIRDVSVAPQEAELIGEIVAAAKATVPFVLRAAKEGQEGANIEATATLMGKVRPQEAIWRAKVTELAALEDQLSRASFEEAKIAQSRATHIMGAMVACALVLGCLIGWRITRSVTRPIGSVIGVAERIARGDLTSDVHPNSNDEVGRLMVAIALMQDRLRDLVGQIRASAESIDVASKEVADGNHYLSLRTEVAASNLQRTASSMEHLMGTVQQNAQAAGRANRLAVTTSEVAARGGSVVAQVVSTMQDIHDSSQRIADIIGLIDGIAFQTNILALNSAVEAARAGEQGRGFAVVAREVRNLAQRSAEAAKEIKVLIGTSVGRIEAGGRLVTEAGETMKDMVGSVEQLRGLTREISMSAEQQSSEIVQINQAIVQLDQMTQQNAALVEESSAAASSLNDEAHRLWEAVTVFQLDANNALESSRQALLKTQPQALKSGAALVERRALIPT